MVLAGIDLGATHLRAAVAREPAAPLAVERVETPTGVDGDDVARAAAWALEAAADGAGFSTSAVDAVGIGSLGPLDRGAGAVVQPPNLAGVDHIPLRDVLIALVGHPRVYLENDAVAALVGELATATPRPSNLVYVTLSTGLGAGAAVDGHVLRGRAGNAAEVGHLVVEPDGRPCGCGGSGHWEAYCSGTGIPAFARMLAERAAVDTELPLAADSFSAADVFATPDDPLAARVIEAVTRYNAIGVADLIHAYAPDRIVVGGAVALENPSLVIDPLAEVVDAHTMLAVPTIEPATHGRDAALRGALSLADQGGLES